jgi:hypothetical protein
MDRFSVSVSPPAAVAAGVDQRYLDQIPVGEWFDVAGLASHGHAGLAIECRSANLPSALRRWPDYLDAADVQPNSADRIPGAADADDGDVGQQLRTDGAIDDVVNRYANLPISPS